MVAGYSPAVDLVNHPCCTCSTMQVLKVFADPVNQVILEDALD